MARPAGGKLSATLLGGGVGAWPRLPTLLGGGLVLLMLACAAVPQWIAPYEPDVFDYVALMAAPSLVGSPGTELEFAL